MVDDVGKGTSHEPRFERLIAVVWDHIRNLPSPPAVCDRLLHKPNGKNNSAGRGESTDPLIGQFRERFGGHTVYGAWLARFADEVMPSREGADRGDFWRHAMAVAVLAESLCDETNEDCDRGIVFAAGLLHDIGKLALGDCLPKTYARVVGQASVQRLDTIQAERTHLGTDHALVGERLLGQWRLPEAIREAIGMHHDPPEAVVCTCRFVHVVTLVQLAHSLLGGGRLGHLGRTDASILQTLVGRLGLTREQAATHVGGSAERARAAADLLLGFLEPGASKTEGRFVSSSSDWRTLRFDTTNGREEETAEIDRWTTAVTRFARSVTFDDRGAEFCGRAVRCTAEALAIDAAVAFITNPSRTIYHCAIFDAGHVRCATIFPSESEIADDALCDAGPAGWLTGPLMIAPSLADPVTDRLGGVFSSGRQVMLPMIHADSLLGGVLFDAHLLPRDGIETRAGLLHMLGATLGGAAAASMRHGEAEVVRASLAEVTRHLAGVREDQVLKRSLSSIAEMAAGAAHELNTPLSVISGRVQMLALGSKDAEDGRQLETIREQAEACSRIVGELLAFAKPRRPRPASIDLAGFLERLRQEWIQRFERMNCAFEVRVADASTLVWADGEQLGVIFDALIANGLAAMGDENGRLKINSGSGASDETVVVTVRDEGCGMSQDVLDRACDPFFSHRLAGRSRGLGLSTARHLVVINAGDLRLESVPGGGTTVFVSLPSGNRPDKV